MSELIDGKYRIELIDGKYRIEAKIASSPLGRVYRGSDVETGERVAIKIEPVKNSRLRLVTEAKLCKLLEGAPGFPVVRWYGVEDEYFIAVVDLLGPSLKDLLGYCGNKFSLSTVLMLADQMLTRIEYMHSKGIVHGAIKPGHFVIGRDSNANLVHLIDLGSAKMYQIAGTSKHMPLAEEKVQCKRCCRYMSVNAHHGLKQSRKDDLESLGYTLVYLLRGQLPWQRKHVGTREETSEQMLTAKVNTPVHELCKGTPQEIEDFCTYSVCLLFDEDPDYNRFKTSFQQLFLREGYLCDTPLDWVVKASGFMKGASTTEELRNPEDATTASPENPEHATEKSLQ
eukprot:TRINITY_DN14919_c0_g1_i1.p1 TRINITY_DN14919_c0_g1~~TRINITY_DN14919_c0_g1_i1.p1  ORF type:complete len:341 (+),score=21.15 TRINITY_DN14919_c0_g1_i1:99-1121(+)